MSQERHCLKQRSVAVTQNISFTYYTLHIQLCRNYDLSRFLGFHNLTYSNSVFLFHFSSTYWKEMFLVFFLQPFLILEHKSCHFFIRHWEKNFVSVINVLLYSTATKLKQFLSFKERKQWPVKTTWRVQAMQKSIISAMQRSAHSIFFPFLTQTHIHSGFRQSNRNASQMPDLTASLTFHLHLHLRLTVN